MNRHLLQAVLDDPRADGPRLAFAAEMEAAGDPERAEFIRLQLARRGGLDEPQRRAWRRRERELLRAHGARWLGELPALEGVRWGARAWRRGFPAFCVVHDPAAFVRHAAALLARVPLEAVSVAGADLDGATALLAVPELARLSELHFECGQGRRRLGDAGVGLLAASPALARFRVLALPAQGIGDAGAQVLALSPHLARLRSLYLADNTIGDEGAAALADSPYLGRLRSLDLLQNAVGPAGALALARSERLLSLHTLEMYGNDHDTASLVALINGPLASWLRHLGWGGGGAVGVEAARAVAEASALTGLRWLDLGNNALGDAGVMYLACSPHLVGLRGLFLRSVELGDAGAAVLARSALAGQLTYLNLENNPITNIGAWELVRSPKLAGIRKLKMWDVDSPNAPVRHALMARFGKRVEVHAGDEYEPDADPVPPPPDTAAAFLADIRNNPDEDAPRLVYADWLEEHDDPERAEFIRLQCSLASLYPDDPEWDGLKRREKELLARNSRRWVEGQFLAWLDHPEARCPIYEPHGVCRLLARATRLRLALEDARGSPQTARLQKELQECEDELEREYNFDGFVATLPLLSRWEFRRGFLESAAVPDFMAYIFAPALRDIGMIRELAVESEEIDTEFGDRLSLFLMATLDRPRLRRLELVTLVQNLSTVEALAAWPGASELRELTELVLWDGAAGDPAVQVLARSPYLGNLERVKLHLGVRYTDEAVEALARSPHLKRLRQVQLYADSPELSPSALALFRERFGAAHPDDRSH